MKSNESTNSFKSKLSGGPVRTNRFLWHISYNHNMLNLFIANDGLICPENYAVFAHNNLTNFNDSYPYFMDLYDLNYGDICYPGMQFLDYSFWRIDTFKIKQSDWFIDPNMELDYLIYCNTEIVRPINFVCTFNSIPNYALELFTIDVERFNNQKSFIKRSNGVANCSPYKNDFDALIPDYSINNYIKWKTGNL
jgi:hypothetical protein